VLDGHSVLHAASLQLDEPLCHVRRARRDLLELP
jgi:hypothetical protein